MKLQHFLKMKCSANAEHEAIENRCWYYKKKIIFIQFLNAQKTFESKVFCAFSTYIKDENYSCPRFKG